MNLTVCGIHAKLQCSFVHKFRVRLPKVSAFQRSNQPSRWFHDMNICSNKLPFIHLRFEKNFQLTRFFFDLWNQNRFIGGVKWDEMGSYTISEHLYPILCAPRKIALCPSSQESFRTLLTRRIG